MGNCCGSKNFSNLEKQVSNKLIEAIDRNSVDRITHLLIAYFLNPTQSEASLKINEPIIKIYGYDMNALGYALFKGYTESFSTLLTVGKAKISMMSKLYEPLNKRPIDILCELGHKQLLEFYLPLYLSKSEENNESEPDSLSLSISRSKNTKSHINEKSKSSLGLNHSSPLHKACEKGMTHIVRFFWEYFENKMVPKEFDVHYQDDFTGDNCALISCKAGNLELIKYLHEVCKADFKVFNKRKESAIQVLAVWSKKKKQKKFKECFRYLIEVVKVDYTYEYEETLLVLEDRSIIFYLEEKLKVDGFSISKSRVDEKYSISKNRVPPVMDPELEIKLSKVKGTKFNFTEIFKQELQDDEISAISEKSVQSVSHINFA